MRLIDADKLMGKTGNYYPSIYCTCMSVPCVKLRDIKNAPTIEVEPVKHGKWKKAYIIPRIGKNVNLPVYKCMNCGSQACDLLSVAGYYNYCPNCGAKMEVGK